MKYIREILPKQMLLTSNEDTLFRRHLWSYSNWKEAACHPVCGKWSKNFQTVIVQDIMSCTITVLRRRNQNASGMTGRVRDRGVRRMLIKAYLDKTASTVRLEAFMIFAVHAVLLKYSAEARWTLFYHGYALVGFLPVEYKEGNSTG